MHLFMPVGDDEIQIESHDRTVNEKVMKLSETEPGSVFIIYDEEYPGFLRAAVKMRNITISFHKTNVVTETQKEARRKNGEKNKSNLKNM